MDNRTYPRISVEPRCKARFQLGGLTCDNIPVTNLGPDGCCIHGSTQTLGELSDKSLLEAWEFIHPSLPKGLINAEVVWVKRNGEPQVEAGVQFLGAQRGYTRHLVTYVASVSGPVDFDREAMDE
jgi:kynurenine formamidase